MRKNSIVTFLGVVVALIASFQLYYNYHSRQLLKVEEQTQVVRIAATGDIMLHSPQITSGRHRDGSYDFSSFFKEIKPYLAAADLSIANLEVTLGGKPPYSGYPRFNSPDKLVTAIRNAGIRVVSTANNHAMDTGILGLKRTYRIVTEEGIKPVGTAISPETRKATLITKNQIKLAFLAYTESSNGLPVPKFYLLNKIDPLQIKKDIKEAKQQGADFVIVSLHFGTEYQRTPSRYQKETARSVFESGADIILGSHPHVIQPMERLKVNGKEKFIIYSMGNFISNQTDPHTDEGVVVYLTIEKKNKKTTLKDVSYLPTYCHRYLDNGKRKYVVIPIEEERPVEPLKYPGLTRKKWAQSYTHTHQQLASAESFQVFRMK